MSLFEIASRVRLQTLIPELHKDHPYQIKTPNRFVSSLEAIQDFSIVAQESRRRFGNPKSITQAVECIKTTVKERETKTPFMRGLLIPGRYHRIFSQSKILPRKVSKAFSSNTVVLNAIKAGYLSIILMNKRLIVNEDELSTDKYNSVNLNLITKAFPTFNREARLSLYLD